MTKKSNSALAIFLIVIMLFTAFPISVTAEETMTITVESKSAMPGSTVDIDVTVSNNPGVAALNLDIDYDKNNLTLTGFNYNTDALAGASVTPYSENATVPCLYMVNGAQNITGDFTFATLTFTVKENARNNASAYIRLSYDPENIYDIAENNLDCAIVDGAVNIFTCMPGDINGDERVNSKDVSRLMQYHAHWDVEVNEPALDTNGDGKHNSKDVTRLMQYIAHWDVILYPLVDNNCNHDLTEYPYTASSCETDGHIAYWACSICGCLFRDAACTQEVEPENTIIPATGHVRVINSAVAATYDHEGLTEGAHCAVCDTVLIAQEIIPVLVPSECSVTYTNLNGAEANNPEKYMSNIGVKSLSDPSDIGYEFLGWYDNDGNKLDYIEPDSGNIVLQARWGNAITYHIYYDVGNATNHANNINHSTYNVKSPTFTLADPSLPGYVFDGWTDEEGRQVTKIVKGTIGDIELTANWKTSRYITRKAEDMINPPYKNSSGINSSGMYYYTYYIGCVDNVPLSSAISFYYDGIGTYSRSYKISTVTSESATISASYAMSSTLSTSVSTTLSAKEKANFGIGEVEVAESVTASIGASVTTSFSESISKTISTSQQEEEIYTYTINDGSPSGYYRYVFMGTLDLFEVIFFDPSTDSLCRQEYAIIREGGNYARDYSRYSDFISDTNVIKLEFDVPSEVEKTVVTTTGCTEGLIIQEYSKNCSVVAYNGSDTDVRIPTVYNGLPVTSFTKDVFRHNKSITSVILGNNITEIPALAFESCTSLESITLYTDIGIDESIVPKCTKIGANAFKGCSNLEFTLPDYVDYIDDGAFQGCEKIDEVFISKDVQYFGYNMFTDCGDLTLTVQPTYFRTIKAANSSGATDIIFDMSEMLNIATGEDFVIDDKVKTVVINGLDAEQDTGTVLSANSISIKATEKIEINHYKLTGNITFDSPKIILNGLNIHSTSSKGFVLPCEHTELTIRGIVEIDHSQRGIKGNNISITAYPGQAGTLSVIGGNGQTDNDGGTAIAAEGTVTIGNYVTMTAVGGKGGNGSAGAYASAGGNGGHGIESESLFVDRYVNLTLVGGNGGNGGKGTNESISVANKWDKGGNKRGGDGGNGGNGGDAFNCYSWEILTDNYSIRGGNGGDGGNGGNGNYTEFNWGFMSLGRSVQRNPGGSGGNGGNGGSGFSLEAGLAGNNGSKGSYNYGGSTDFGGEIYYQKPEGVNGTPGAVGQILPARSEGWQSFANSFESASGSRYVYVTAEEPITCSTHELRRSRRAASLFL